MVDFPHPECPTMPIFYPASTSKLAFLSIGSASPSYLKVTLLNLTEPKMEVVSRWPPYYILDYSLFSSKSLKILLRDYLVPLVSGK